MGEGGVMEVEWRQVAGELLSCEGLRYFFLFFLLSTLFYCFIIYLDFIYFLIYLYLIQFLFFIFLVM